jgi:hypothetical protein
VTLGAQVEVLWKIPRPWPSSSSRAWLQLLSAPASYTEPQFVVLR